MSSDGVALGDVVGCSYDGENGEDTEVYVAEKVSEVACDEEDEDGKRKQNGIDCYRGSIQSDVC